MSRLNKARKLDDEMVKAGVRLCMSQPDGRRFIWRLFDWTNILANAMREDDRTTAFALGEQNIGQHLLALLEQVDSEAWLRLRAEQLEFMEQFEGSEDDE